MFIFKRRVTLLLLLAGSVIASSDPLALKPTLARSEFLQAQAALDIATPTADSAVLQAYVLYPYLQAARFKRALMRADRDVAVLDNAIKAWLQTQGNAPVTSELRRQWLLDLAARQQWRDFQTYLPVNPDAELRCLNATAVLSDSSASLAPEQINALSVALTGAWLNANRLPAVCNAPFEWARSNKIITPALIEQRARLALKAGNTELARDLAAMLPPVQAEPLRQWAQLIETPQAAIDALIKQPRTHVESVALQDGWLRLARKNVDEAVERLPRLIRARHLNTATASPYVLSVALALAWNRQPKALEYFARVQPADMTDQAQEWQVRAALWSGDWQRVTTGIAAMPEALRMQARWRYWLARAQQQRNEVAAATASYQRLVANDDNYYAAMAAARLATVYAPHLIPLPDDAGMVGELVKLPGLQRIQELLAVQMHDAANAEWSAVFSGLQPGEHLAAAKLVHQWGWFEQAIATTAKLGLYNDYVFLYPQPYLSEVQGAASLSGLPIELIYGVMRQETLFRPDARSSANARGLLQLLPDTARSTARKFNMAMPTAEQLYDPTINIPLGALNLKMMLEAANGQLALALASYNAGPIAARRWLPPQPMESDIWVENIPYNETRAYVQRVLWHSLVFRWLRNTKPLDTQSWLAPIQP